MGAHRNVATYREASGRFATRRRIARNSCYEQPGLPVRPGKMVKNKSLLFAPEELMKSMKISQIMKWKNHLAKTLAHSFGDALRGFSGMLNKINCAYRLKFRLRIKNFNHTVSTEQFANA